MPEDQKPFIHQDGSSTPPARTPPTKQLDTSALASQVRELRVLLHQIDLGRLQGAADLGTIEAAIDSLQLLQEPRVNTTVGALKLLAPGMQALVSDIAVALTANDTGQQNLANALRKLIEGRS